MVYRVKSEQVALTKRIIRSVFIFSVVMLGAFLIHRFWFAKNAWTFGERIFDALVAAFGYFFLESRRREYDIEVTEETISMRGQSLVRSRSVRRGHIHYLRELPRNLFREPALRLSEHGAIYRFLFGYVWIPTSLPQYEQIKAKATNWREIG